MEIPEVKSLRWLANVFPLAIPARDEHDKLCNAIHLYSTAGADKIEAQAKRIEELEIELQAAFNTINDVGEQIKAVEKNYDHLADLWAQVPPKIKDMVTRICGDEFEELEEEP